MKIKCDLSFSKDEEMTVQVAPEYVPRFLDAVNHKWELSFPAEKALLIFTPLTDPNMADASAGFDYLKIIVDDTCDNFLNLSVEQQPNFHPFDNVLFVSLKAYFD